MSNDNKVQQERISMMAMAHDEGITLLAGLAEDGARSIKDGVVCFAGDHDHSKAINSLVDWFRETLTNMIDKAKNG